MVLEVDQPGVFLTGRDCALIDRALRVGLAQLAVRDGACPAGVAQVTAAILAAAAEFRYRNQADPRSAAGSARKLDPDSTGDAGCDPIELTCTEVARRYGWSASWARRLAATGAVTARRTSSGWLVDAGSAATWAARRTEAA